MVNANELQRHEKSVKDGISGTAKSKSTNSRLMKHHKSSQNDEKDLKKRAAFGQRLISNNDANAVSSDVRQFQIQDAAYENARSLIRTLITIHRFFIALYMNS